MINLSFFEPLLHLVLLEPRIAGNVGAVARMSVGTGCALHICGDVPFDGGSKQMRRAGLDYWPSAQVFFHQSLDRCLEYLEKEPYVLEVGSDKAPWDVSFQQGDVVVLGPEDGSVFLPQLKKERILTLPTQGGIRSLNLAQCASIVAFEAMRQHCT